MEQQCQPCPLFRNFVGIKLLGSYNRKKESKIAVAKRQRKESAREKRTKEGLRTEVRTSGEASSPPG